MGKKITDEDLNVNMSINGINKTQAEISKIQTSVRKLTDENKDLAAAKRKLIVEGKRESQTYKDLTAQQGKNKVAIDEYTKKQSGLQKQLGLTGLTMRQLGKHQNSLKAQMNNFVPGTPEWKKLNAELQETNARLGKVRGEMNQTGGVMSRMQKSLGGFGSLLLGGAGIMAAWNGVKKLVTMNAELSDSQANVRKTTGLTDAAVGQLTKTLKGFNTRTPVTELLALAEEAGRLGKKSVADIEGFVRTADKISVALGDDLQGDITENVRLIGKLTEQYQVGDKYGGNFEKTMERMGSAVNEVAASGSNQASFLVDYLSRLSGVSKQTNISADDQLGYAAALDESAQSVEVSGTTMSKIIVDMYKNADEYAQIAGVSTMEFSELLKTDANEALLIFLEGLNGNNEGFEQMTKKMEGLKLEGARSVAVLSSLAANTDNVRAKQEIANKAIIEATSLTEEFNVKNNNLAGNLEKLGNTVSNYFKNSALTFWLTEVTSGFLQLIGVTKTSAEAFSIETKAKSDNVLANRALAETSSKLLDEYESLTKDGVKPTIASKERLDEITYTLRKNLGESVVSIDKETGAFTLNTEAVKKQITAKRLAANASASELASDLVGNKQKLESLKKEQTRIKKDLAISERLVTDADKAAETAAKYAPAGFKAQEVPESVANRNRELKKLIDINKEIAVQDARKIEISAALKKSYFDPNDVEAIFAPETDGPDKPEGLSEDEEAELAKNKERRAKDAIAFEARRKTELQNLDDKYIKEKQDRLAVGYVAQAELEKARAIEQAEGIMATNATLDLIKEEHDLKIQEAKDKEELDELTRLDKFHNQKQALEDELALNKAETDLEKEILAQELKYDKDQERLQRDLEALLLTETEKNQLVELLTEAHEGTLADIKQKYADKQIVSDREVYDNKLQLLNQSLDASIQAVGAETKLGQGLLLIKQVLAAKEMAIELGLFTAKTSMAASGATVDIAAGTAKSASAAPFPANIPLIIGFIASVAGIISTIKGAASKGKSSVKGFEDGFYSDVVRTDGKRFNARNMGRSGTQIVNEPSYFSNNGGFLTGEAGPEMIIDNDVYRRLDPKIINNIMETRHNVKGFESGMYPNEAGGSSDPELKIMIAAMMNVLQNPPSPNILWGYDEAEKNTTLQTEIAASKNNGKLTS
jgi:hypothetical protein